MIVAFIVSIGKISLEEHETKNKAKIVYSRLHCERSSLPPRTPPRVPYLVSEEVRLMKASSMLSLRDECMLVAGFLCHKV